MIGFLKRRYNEIIKHIKDSEKIRNELLYAHIFDSTIRGSDWLKDTSFSFTGGACNYTFAYILYRILNSDMPLNILEMGMGQTSKITTQYVIYKNENSFLDIVEHDKKWIEISENNIKTNDRIKILTPDLSTFSFDGQDNYRYKDLKSLLGARKYNLVIVDGPYGGGTFARPDVLDLIPENLGDEFIIILDDVERKGEYYLMREIFKKLEMLSIKYDFLLLAGTKKQVVIMSEKYKHIKFY